MGSAPDPLITNQLLYQLSYAGNDARSLTQPLARDKGSAPEAHIRERASTESGSAVSSVFMTVLK